MERYLSPRSWMKRWRSALASVARFNPSSRPWHMPVAAALATGLPLIFAASQGSLASGMPASLGGLAFLYLPHAGFADRVARLMACAFGLLACYIVGALCQLMPAVTIYVLSACTAAASMACRYYRVPPPGVLFFVMTGSIAAYAPAPGLQWMTSIGAFGMGCVLAVTLGVAYSLQQHLAAHASPTQAASGEHFDFDEVVTDSVVIALSVAASLAAAAMLHLQCPYWVPVSCVAMFRATSLEGLWIRQAHRIAGTTLGIFLFWIVATLQLDAWGVALVMTALTFTVESLVVRHYGLAVAFLTPYALLMAEAAQLAQRSPSVLMQARLVDTVVGATIGLAGGACLHTPRIRAAIGQWLRRLRFRTGSHTS